MERYQMRLFIEQFSSWVIHQFYALLRANSEEEQEKAKCSLLWAIRQGLFASTEVVVQQYPGSFHNGKQFYICRYCLHSMGFTV
jgi:hypothetical protein